MLAPPAANSPRTRLLHTGALLHLADMHAVRAAPPAAAPRPCREHSHYPGRRGCFPSPGRPIGPCESHCVACCASGLRSPSACLKTSIHSALALPGANRASSAADARRSPQVLSCASARLEKIQLPTWCDIRPLSRPALHPPHQPSCHGPVTCFGTVNWAAHSCAQNNPWAH